MQSPESLFGERSSSSNNELNLWEGALYPPPCLDEQIQMPSDLLESRTREEGQNGSFGIEPMLEEERSFGNRARRPLEEWMADESGFSAG